MKIELSLDLRTKMDIATAVGSCLPANYTDHHYLYMIECRRKYEGSLTAMEGDHSIRKRANALKQYDSLPWLNRCLEAHTLVYIGESSDIVRRLHEHMWDRSQNGRAALFTKLFPPHYLRDLKWFPNKDAATLAEKNVRKILNRQFRDQKAFAYSDVDENETWTAFFS